MSPSYLGRDHKWFRLYYNPFRNINDEDQAIAIPFGHDENALFTFYRSISPGYDEVVNE